jgi:hypothetical protein
MFNTKRILNGFSLALLALFALTQVSGERSAHAMFLVMLPAAAIISAGDGTDFNLDFMAWPDSDSSHTYWNEVFGCLVFMPICVLDEKAGPSTFNDKDLADNGYNPAVIRADQKTIMQRLAETKQSIKFEKSDNLASVGEGLKQIYPAVSDEYVQFVADQLP